MKRIFLLALSACALNAKAELNQYAAITVGDLAAEASLNNPALSYADGVLPVFQDAAIKSGATGSEVDQFIQIAWEEMNRRYHLLVRQASGR